MADVTPTEPVVVKDPVPVQTDITEKAVPYDRFKEVNDRMKAAEEKLRAAETERAKAADDELKRKGELKTLLEQRDSQLAAIKVENEALAAKAAKADEAEKALREQTLAKITDPELKRVAGDLPTPSLLIFADRVVAGKITPHTDKDKLGQLEHDPTKWKNADEYKDALRKAGRL
jgi:uncharacterized protein (UPF0216 family)